MGDRPPEVDELRSRAVDHIRASQWRELLALQPELQRDHEYWTALWGPACAVAAHHEGRPDARALLTSLVDAGFYDLRTHAELFAGSFATDPDWPALRARIEANTPPPPVELLEWPCTTPGHLGLDRLEPAAEAALAARVPTAADSARETALATLAWVTSRWRHSGANHVAGRDANAVLDRVEAGQRFACREYTIVLTQALNAIGVPARHLALFRDEYHAGIGTGHAVTEAWLDDEGRWVVLDGQNGATWRDERGELLGVRELQQRLADGRLATFVGSGPNFDPASGPEWGQYFQHWTTGGAAWRSGSFVPVMEGRTVLEARPLLSGSHGAHPDLAELGTCVVDDRGRPALLFVTEHPYAVGFDVTDEQGARRDVRLDEPVPLAGPDGTHAWQVATRTPFGTLRPAAVRFVVRSA